MNREHLESMRWLYDSDESYKKAVRAILAEEVKEKRRAMLKKKLRQARFQKKVRTITGPFKKLKIGSFKLGSFKLKYVPQRLKGLAKKTVATKKRIALTGAVMLGLLVVGVLSVGMFESQKQPEEAKGDSDVAGVSTTAPEAPFDPLITSDKASKPDDYRYEESKNLLTYTATIGTTKATISQQPFPEDFIKDSAKFEQFLESIPEKKTIPLSSGTAYLSVNKEDDLVQFGVYMTPEFLVFLRTEEPIEKEKWQEYFKYITLN